LKRRGREEEGGRGGDEEEGGKRGGVEGRKREDIRVGSNYVKAG